MACAAGCTDKIAGGRVGRRVGALDDAKMVGFALIFVDATHMAS